MENTLHQYGDLEQTLNVEGDIPNLVLAVPEKRQTPKQRLAVTPALHLSPPLPTHPCAPGPLLLSVLHPHRHGADQRRQTRNRHRHRPRLLRRHQRPRPHGLRPTEAGQRNRAPPRHGSARSSACPPAVSSRPRSMAASQFPMLLPALTTSSSPPRGISRPSPMTKTLMTPSRDRPRPHRRSTSQGSTSQADQSANVEIRLERGGSRQRQHPFRRWKPGNQRARRSLRKSKDKWVPLPTGDYGAFAMPSSLMTDDLGHYRIGGLRDGEYIVTVTLVHADMLPARGSRACWCAAQRSALFTPATPCAKATQSLSNSAPARSEPAKTSPSRSANYTPSAASSPRRATAMPSTAAISRSKTPIDKESVVDAELDSEGSLPPRMASPKAHTRSAS